jgi:phosphate transport system substrate-binding protein
MFRIKSNTLLPVAVVVATVVAASAPSARAETLNGAGATFPYPIYSKWFQAYTRANPGTTFNYQAVGSGAGIAQYKAGTVFFGGTDAPLSDAEARTMPQPTLHIPTVAGSIVLAYNVPGVGPGLRLSGDVIADIFLGQIKAWNDPRLVKLNPRVDLPSTAISVAHRSDGSGTTNIFTTYLSAVSPAWKQKVGAGKSVSWPVGLGGSGNPGVAGLIKNSTGSIGYVIGGS